MCPVAPSFTSPYLPIQTNSHPRVVITVGLGATTSVELLSIVLSIAAERPLPWRASRRAVFPALSWRRHRRGTLPVQISIAELAARPAEDTARDFVPWRFSDAGRRSVGLGRRCRRPKTCTESDISPAGFRELGFAGLRYPLRRERVDDFFRVHHVYLPASLRNQKHLK
jgi:hypothetical protein